MPFPLDLVPENRKSVLVQKPDRVCADWRKTENLCYKDGQILHPNFQTLVSPSTPCKLMQPIHQYLKLTFINSGSPGPGLGCSADKSMEWRPLDVHKKQSISNAASQFLLRLLRYVWHTTLSLWWWPSRGLAAAWSRSDCRTGRAFWHGESEFREESHSTLQQDNVATASQKLRPGSKHFDYCTIPIAILPNHPYCTWPRIADAAMGATSWNHVFV